MQALLAGGDDLVTFCKALQHFNTAGAADTQFDLNPLGDFFAGIAAINHFVHEHPLALRNNRFLGDHQRPFALAKHCGDPCEHAWAKAQLPVVDATANADGAAIGVNQRIYRLHKSSETLARQCIQIDHRGLAPFNLVLESLGQPEIHKHGVNILNVHHIGAVLEVVPHVRRANAGYTVKRGKHLEPRGRRLRQRQLGLRDFQIGGAFIDRSLADEVLLDQFLIALVVGLRDGQLGLALLHLCQLKLVVKLHQQLPFFDTVPVAEIELRDASADFRADDHALARAQAAYRLGVVGKAADLYLRHFDGWRPGRRRSRRRPTCRTPSCRCGRWVRRRRTARSRLGFVLVPPGSARRQCKADHGNNGINYFGCHGAN